MPQTTLLSFLQKGAAYPDREEKPQLVEVTQPITVVNQDIEATEVQGEPTHINDRLSISSTPKPLSATFATEDEVFIPVQCSAAAIVRVRASLLPSLKAITGTLLPVKYPEKFYNECVQDKSVGDLCRVLLWNSKVVGWIRCRLDPTTESGFELYIQALGVLAPYRGLGLASALLERVTLPQIVKEYNIRSMSAHVWQTNSDALEWYDKKGFHRVRLEEHYYRRLRPAGAWIVRKDIS